MTERVCGVLQQVTVIRSLSSTVPELQITTAIDCKELAATVPVRIERQGRALSC